MMSDMKWNSRVDDVQLIEYIFDNWQHISTILCGKHIFDHIHQNEFGIGAMQQEFNETSTIGDQITY